MVILTDTLLFLGLCLSALAAGVGLLRLVGFPRDLPSTLLLAPAAINALWTVAGNVLLRSGLAMRQAASPLWVLTLLLGAVGLVTLWRSRRRRDAGWRGRDYLLTFGVLAATVWLVAWPLFARGLTRHLGSPQLETVTYTTVAALYWQYGLDYDQPMPPVEQRMVRAFRNFAPCRNFAFVLLAFLSPLVEAGEPVTVRNLFVCWSFVLLASSLAFYEVSRRAVASAPASSLAETIRLPLYVVVTMGLGWAAVPALIGNWDNVVAVHLGPALAGLALRAAPNPGYALLLGSLVAYGMYGYVELAPAVLLLVSPFFALALVDATVPRRAWLAYAGAAAIATVWLAPGIERLAWYFWLQWNYARGAVGGRFAFGLVEHATSPATWWAFGPEHLFTISGWDRFVAAVLTGLALLGVARIARGGSRPELFAFGLGLAATSYFVIVERYAYGAYKILSVSWWLWGRALTEGVCGVLTLAHRAPHGVRRRAATAVLALVVIGVVGAGVDRVRTVRVTAYLPDDAYRQQPTVKSLLRLRDAARREPPENVLMSADDGVRTPWMFYALRSTSLTLFHPQRLRMPMPGSRPWPRDDAPPLAGIVVPATRAWLYAGARRRFETSDFVLVAPTAGVLLEDVENPNGLGAGGMWLGTQPATLTVLAEKEARIALTVDAVADPSIRSSARRTLALRGETGDIARETFEGNAKLWFEFDVHRGRNVLALAALDRPPDSPEPDPRARSIRIEALTLELASLAETAPRAEKGR